MTTHRPINLKLALWLLTARKRFINQHYCTNALAERGLIILESNAQPLLKIATKCRVPLLLNRSQQHPAQKLNQINTTLPHCLALDKHKINASSMGILHNYLLNNDNPPLIALGVAQANSWPFSTLIIYWGEPFFINTHSQTSEQISDNIKQNLLCATITAQQMTSA